MYKKLIIAGLLLISSWITPTDDPMIPYEKFVAAEYNRIRHGADRYVSYNAIMNQNLRGKSMEQKRKILANLQGLEVALGKAYLQADQDGKRLWYYFYIWKDNNPIIQSLIQYQDDVINKIRETQDDMQSDAMKLFRYISPYISGAIAGITLLWLTQGNLSYEHYVEHKNHGLIEMLAAPIQSSIQHTIKNLATMKS